MAMLNNQMDDNVNGLVFTGKSEPETIDFPMKIMGLSGSIFPLNQSIDVCRLWQDPYEFPIP